MPICSDVQSEQKKDVISKAAKDNNLTAVFPHYNKDAEIFDLSSMLKSLRKMLFVVVDLSLERPSCYYELGIVESLGIKTFIFAQKGTDIHQTTYRSRVIFYNDLEDFEKLMNRSFSEEISHVEILTT